VVGYVYILRSLKNGRYYVGSTNDLEKRVMEHNAGKSKYTSFSLPFELVFSQVFDVLSIARKVEYKLKRLKSKKVIEEIIDVGVIDLDRLRVNS